MHHSHMTTQITKHYKNNQFYHKSQIHPIIFLNNQSVAKDRLRQNPEPPNYLSGEMLHKGDVIYCDNSQ